MNIQELRHRLELLRQGKLTSREAYHTVHDFGKMDFLEARPEVEHLLTSEDPQLRSIALEVLTRHWRLSEYLKTAQEILEHDPDVDCRMRVSP